MKKTRLLKRGGDILLLAGIIAVVTEMKGWSLITLIGSGIILSALGTIPEHKPCGETEG